METATDIRPSNRKREDSFSGDGKWRAFPKVPNLLQYVNSSTYYGRTKVGGKLIRESLNTAVGTTAKAGLVDFLQENQGREAMCCRPNSQKL
jgi:hypothetical protein